MDVVDIGVTPYVTITGKKAKHVFINDDNINTLYEIIKKKIDKHVPISFGCKVYRDIIDPKSGQPVRMQAQHGYSVLDSCEVKEVKREKCLHLRNSQSVNFGGSKRKR